MCDCVCVSSLSERGTLLGYTDDRYTALVASIGMS